MARPKSFRDLIVWQKAMGLARFAYAVTTQLPDAERYGLTSHIRRAAVSVPSNIAEGHGRLTDQQFRQFLGNARGSLYELQTQIELAIDLRLLDQECGRKLMEHGDEVARLMNGLLASLGEQTANSASSANR